MVPRSTCRIVHEAPFHDEGHGFDVFGLHPPTLARVVAAARPLYERYFRVDSEGVTRIPARGPVVLVANHGGVLPVDGAMLCLDVLLRGEPPRIPRPIADRFVSRLPVVSTWFARVGAVSGIRANVRRLLERDELTVVFPEGVAGPAKRFADRYTLQAWHVGFCELAIRCRATIVPAAILGAEESWPLLGRLDGLHPFGAPYLPVPACPVPLPAHYRIRYGEALHVGAEPRDADDPGQVAATAREVRDQLARLVADARDARRGVFR